MEVLFLSFDLKSTQFLNLIQSKFSKILSKKHEDEYQIREIMLLEIRDDNEPTNEDLHNIGKTVSKNTVHLVNLQFI